MQKPPQDNGPDHGNAAPSNGAHRNQLDLVALYRRGARAITDQIRRQLLSLTLFAFLPVFGFHEMGRLRQKRSPQTVATEENHLRTVNKIWLGLDTIGLEALTPCDIGNMCDAVRNAQKPEARETDLISSYDALAGATASLVRFLAGPPFALFSKQRLEELLNMIQLEGFAPPNKCPQTCSKDKSVDTTETQQPNIGSEGAASPAHAVAPTGHDAQNQPDELAVMAELRLALVSGVTDIGADLRLRASLLPLRSFVHLYAIDWCKSLRGLGATEKECSQLNLISKICDEFNAIPLGTLDEGGMRALRSALESAKSPKTGAPYKTRTRKLLVLTAGRLLQFVASPPLAIIESDRACRMLAVVDYEAKGKAAKRILTQLNTWTRTVRWREALQQLRREEQLRGVAPSVTEERIARCTEFLYLNGQDLDAPAERSFVNAVRLALNGGKTGPASQIKFPEGPPQPSVSQSHVDPVLRTCEALAEGNFSIALRRYLPFAGGLTHAEISKRCGLAPGLVHSLLTHNTAGPTNINAEQALRLDALLEARGNLFASYAVTTQEVAYENLPPVIDVILNRSCFAQKLRSLRLNKQLTGPQLVQAIQACDAEKRSQQEIGVLSAGGVEAAGPIQRFNAVQLNQWEQDISLPCQGMGEVIDALDDFFDANGTLKDAWLAERPRQVLEAYVLRWDDWPEELQRQFHRLALYKTCNPEGFDESPRDGDRWNCLATEDRFRAFCEHFFGYLVHHKAHRAEDLSVSLLCDFALVLGFYVFLRDRSGQKQHSLFAKTTTLTLLNLFVYYMPHIGEEAAREAHWQKLFGLAKPPAAPFADFWQNELGRTIARAKNFLKHTPFRSERLTRKAARLIDAGVGVSQVLAELGVRSGRMPVLILTPKAAVLSRRLVLAILVTLQLYPAPVLLALKVGENIWVKPNGRVGLRIPKELFRGGNKGGGINGEDGELEGPDFVHLEVRRYLEESRPLLVGNEADAGFFFTAGGGRPLSLHWINADVRIMLGYRFYGVRDIFTATARRHGMPPEDAGLKLHVNPQTVTKTSKRLEKTRKANLTVQSMLRRPGDLGNSRTA